MNIKILKMLSSYWVFLALSPAIGWHMHHPCADQCHADFIAVTGTHEPAGQPEEHGHDECCTPEGILEHVLHQGVRKPETYHQIADLAMRSVVGGPIFSNLEAAGTAVVLGPVVSRDRFVGYLETLRSPPIFPA